MTMSISLPYGKYEEILEFKLKNINFSIFVNTREYYCTVKMYNAISFKKN